MKKAFSLVCVLFVALALVLPNFSYAKKTERENTAFANIEEVFYNNNAFDLISRNPSGSISNGVLENTAPFDTDTNQKMEGMSITPNADDYGQLKSKNFKINNYKPSEGDVLYLWVYLIDALSFKLQISLMDSMSNSITWEFDTMKLFEMGTGWKLLGLKLSDFDGEKDYTNQIYEYISFTYKADDEELAEGENYEDIADKATEKFSFYHVFVSDVVEENKASGMVAELSQTFCKFSKNFPFGGTVFIGDKIKIQKPADIFDYLYIGKYDLSNYTTSGRYYWTLSIESPSQMKSSLDFGDMIFFSELGFYCLTIQLVEVGTFQNIIRLNRDISIFCDEAHFGSFSMGTNYKIKDTEKLLLTFKITDNFVLSEDYVINVNNKNAEIESYYEENGVIYICVAGKSGGKCDVEISAKGTSRYNTTQTEFLSKATINIESTKKKVDVFLVILWVTFACFCVGIVIYLVISLVKARKNDVK